jgi:hypothetical protein
MLGSGVQANYSVNENRALRETIMFIALQMKSIPLQYQIQNIHHGYKYGIILFSI